MPKRCAARSLAPALLLAAAAATAAPTTDAPSLLTVRQRAAFVNGVTRQRLDRLLPEMMRQAGFDMWIIACNEDALDPVFETMMPYANWCPITQILVLFDGGPAGGVERLNVSRTDTQGFFRNVWDAAAWDAEAGESQWACLGRVVRERDPRRIGINVGEVQWAAGALSAVLKERVVSALGPDLAARLASAEPLATLWLETLLDEEVEIMERAAAVSRSLIAEMFSSRVVTPGVTTVDDLRFFYWQKAADLGLGLAFYPFISIRSRDPEVLARFGKEDAVLRPGDFIHCDVGVKYMRWNSDHQEVAYVLKPGETDAPEPLRRLMAEANRLQDVYCGEFKTGLTGNEILGNVLARARALGIPGPKVYSHSLGYCLHEPGPLIGLPWEQVDNPGRGEVRLVPMSCFTAEMSVSAPVPEWGGRDVRMPLEQDIVFTGSAVHFLAGRQTAFHLIR